MPQLAEALNISRAEMHGVVTFYHDFKREPQGRHVLKICRAESCQSMGAEKMARDFLDPSQARLGRDDAGRRLDGGGHLLSRTLFTQPFRACMTRSRSAGSTVRGSTNSRKRRKAHDQDIHPPRHGGARHGREAGSRRGRSKEIAARGLDVEIVRNGSRGMLWLEPLVEVETPAGRVGYGPVKLTDVASLFDAGFPVGRRASAVHRQGRGASLFRPPAPRDLRSAAASSTRCPSPNMTAHGGYKGLDRAFSIGPEATVVEESPTPACAAAAARASRPASNGRPSRTVRRGKNMSWSTPTRAIAAPSPTA